MYWPRRADDKRKKVAKAALFDLDGTLVESDAAVVWCVNELLRRLSLPPADPAEIIGLIGVGLTPLLKEFMPEPEAHVAEYQRLYRQGFGDRTKVYEGTAVTLSALRKAGIKTGLVTNRNKDLAVTIVAHFGLDDLFDTLIGDGEGWPLKPDPAMVFEACRRLGVEPRETILAGDTLIDVATGRNAGCETVLLNYKGVYKESDADHVIVSLPKILDFFKGS